MWSRQDEGSLLEVQEGPTRERFRKCLVPAWEAEPASYRLGTVVWSVRPRTGQHTRCIARQSRARRPFRNFRQASSWKAFPVCSVSPSTKGFNKLSEPQNQVKACKETQDARLELVDELRKGYNLVTTFPNEHYNVIEDADKLTSGWRALHLAKLLISLTMNKLEVRSPVTSVQEAKHGNGVLISIS